MSTDHPANPVAADGAEGADGPHRAHGPDGPHDPDGQHATCATGPRLYLAWAAFQRRPAAMAPLAGFECVFLPMAYKGPSHVLRAWHYLRLGAATLRLLRTRQPAQLWLQLPQVPLLWVALLYRWLHAPQLPLVADCHNAMFRPPWAHMPWGLRALRLATLVLVHNRDMLAQAQALGVPAAQLRVLDDVPVPPPPGPPPPVPAAFAGRARPWVLFAGSYGADEPVAQVLTAAAGLRQGVVALTGRLSNAARHGHDISRPPAQAVLTGYLPLAEFDALLAHADVVLALTRQDGIQLSVCNEALGHGKPLVMSDTPLLRSLFGRGAVCVDSQDAQALRAGIEQAWRERLHWADAAQRLADERLRQWSAGPWRACQALLARRAEGVAVAGRLGTPQLACLRSWRRQGLRTVFLHTAPVPLPAVVRAVLGVLLGTRCVHMGPLPTGGDSAQGAPSQPAGERLATRWAQVLAQESVAALSCVSEPEAMALWALQPRLPAGLRLLCARPLVLGPLASKLAQHQAAQRAGLSVLPCWTFSPGATACVPPSAFPMVLRPDVPRAAGNPFKLLVVHDAQALQAVLSALPAACPGLVGQPLVRGHNLLVHGWRAPQASGVLASAGLVGAESGAAGHLAWRAEVTHAGFTVLLQPVELDPALQRACARLEASLGLQGVFHYDFVQCPQTGQCYFLDLNPRLGGSTGKVLASGYDEPLALLATAWPGRWAQAAFVETPRRAAGARQQALAALWADLRGRRSDADQPALGLPGLRPRLLRFVWAGCDELFTPPAGQRGAAARARMLASLAALLIYRLWGLAAEARPGWTWRRRAVGARPATLA